MKEHKSAPRAKPKAKQEQVEKQEKVNIFSSCSLGRDAEL